MRRFVVGDIHGAHKALLQVLRRSGFDRDNDLLISLGDVVDGWPDVKQCVNELLSIKHLVFILGNHDKWFLDWIRTRIADELWTSQGGEATLKSYRGKVPKTHRQFFENAPFYHLLDNMVFVHGGLDPKESDMSKQDPENLIWDRRLFEYARRISLDQIGYNFGPWDKIFVGHTPTIIVKKTKPLVLCNVVAMDTGAGWGGKLSLMDIDTLKIWQSDKIPKLYPGVVGRGG